MIESIEDLIEHSRSTLLMYSAAAQAGMYERVIFERNGCSAEDIELIKGELPDLPGNYLKVIQELNLYKKGMLGIEFSPGPMRLPYVKQVIHQNQKVSVKDSGYYVVGHRESDLILITRVGQNELEGQVSILIDDLVPKIQLLASSFWDFILICANLEKSGTTKDADADLVSITNVLEYFKMGNAIDAWKYIIAC